MIYLLLLLLIVPVQSSHYRGGTLAYSMLGNTGNITNNPYISVWIYQRHSWRRSAEFCNSTDLLTRPTIGEGQLLGSYMSGSNTNSLPFIEANVPCTDFSESYDYSSGEGLVARMMPNNRIMEYHYRGCCWIDLLYPDTAGNWSLKMIINTQRRLDGKLNNSPKTTINPVVQVQVGKTHVIRIPMADTDGDRLACRWGRTATECGDICTPKGHLRSNPCELVYNATKIGHHGVALIIEDFDRDNTVLSSVPLQFLIEIVNITQDSDACSVPPIYVGDLPDGSCIAAQTGQETRGRIQFRIPCLNTSTTLAEILTITPSAFETMQFVRDPNDPNLYTAEFVWIPQARQGGIQQACFTPITSNEIIGDQICFTFHVDSIPPRLLEFTPTGIVPEDQSLWKILLDQQATPPRKTEGVFISFFKTSTNHLVLQIDAMKSPNVKYQGKEIHIFTPGFIWQEGEHYHIKLSHGIAISNQSCGVESESIADPNTWTFEILKTTTEANQPPTTIGNGEMNSIVTEEPNMIITEEFNLTKTDQPNPVVTERPDSTKTEEPNPTVTEEASPTETDRPNPMKTDEPNPMVTEDLSPTETERPNPIETERPNPIETERPNPTQSEEQTTIENEQTNELVTEKPNPIEIAETTTNQGLIETIHFETETNSTSRYSTTTVTTAKMEISTSSIDESEVSISTSPSIIEQLLCPRWLKFDSLSQEILTAHSPTVIFCFDVTSNYADVVISANTWVSCVQWKSSGKSDPFMELYSVKSGQLLAQNDDGINANGFNCFGSVLSYRLYRGHYRVVIRANKCSYGSFELSLTSEKGILSK